MKLEDKKKFHYASVEQKNHLENWVQEKEGIVIFYALDGQRKVTKQIWKNRTKAWSERQRGTERVSEQKKMD